MRSQHAIVLIAAALTGCAQPPETLSGHKKIIDYDGCSAYQYGDDQYYGLCTKSPTTKVNKYSVFCGDGCITYRKYEEK